MKLCPGCMQVMCAGSVIHCKSADECIGHTMKAMKPRDQIKRAIEDQDRRTWTKRPEAPKVNMDRMKQGQREQDRRWEQSEQQQMSTVQKEAERHMMNMKNTLQQRLQSAEDAAQNAENLLQASKDNTEAWIQSQESEFDVLRVRCNEDLQRDGTHARDVINIREEEVRETAALEKRIFDIQTTESDLRRQLSVESGAASVRAFEAAAGDQRVTAVQGQLQAASSAEASYRKKLAHEQGQLHRTALAETA